MEACEQIVQLNTARAVVPLSTYGRYINLDELNTPVELTSNAAGDDQLRGVPPQLLGTSMAMLRKLVRFSQLISLIMHSFSF